MAKKVYTVTVPPRETVIDIHGRRIGAGKEAKVYYSTYKSLKPKEQEAEHGN